jgi:outer membrane protein assembly factor BamD
MIRRILVLLLAAGAVSTGTACAAKKAQPKHAVEVLTADETLRRVGDAMARHQLRKAKTLLQKIQFTTEERATYEPLVRLALADSTYYLGDDLSLIEARSKYLDFVTLYGDHPKAPYAQFQAGMSSVKQIYSASRDQAQTQVALDDFAEIEKRWPTSPYGRAARQFVARGKDGLAEHEFVVGTFYRKKKSYDAAVLRYRGLLESYPQYRAKDKLYYWLGWTLFENRQPAQGRVYLDQVVSDYPKSRYAPLAKRILFSSAKKDAAEAGKKKES